MRVRLVIATIHVIMSVILLTFVSATNVFVHLPTLLVTVTAKFSRRDVELPSLAHSRLVTCESLPSPKQKWYVDHTRLFVEYQDERILLILNVLMLILPVIVVVVA